MKRADYRLELPIITHRQRDIGWDNNFAEIHFCVILSAVMEVQEYSVRVN